LNEDGASGNNSDGTRLKADGIGFFDVRLFHQEETGVRKGLPDVEHNKMKLREVFGIFATYNRTHE